MVKSWILCTVYWESLIKTGRENADLVPSKTSFQYGCDGGFYRKQYGIRYGMNRTEVGRNFAVKILFKLKDSVWHLINSYVSWNLGRIYIECFELPKKSWRILAGNLLSFFEFWQFFISKKPGLVKFGFF